MTIKYKTIATVSMLALIYVIRKSFDKHDNLNYYTAKKINNLEKQIEELKEKKGE